MTDVLQLHLWRPPGGLREGQPLLRRRRLLFCLRRVLPRPRRRTQAASTSRASFTVDVSHTKILRLVTVISGKG